MSDDVISPNAASGFHDADAYDTYRPSYPADAVDQLLDRLEVTTTQQTAVIADHRPLRIVEIGAGTGKFTEVLARRAAAQATTTSVPWTIVAVEPHTQMRAQLAAKALPHVTVVDGYAADVRQVADGRADAVVIAQAFHWWVRMCRGEKFASMESLKEVHRILKPGALVGLIWNIDDYNKPLEWPAQTRWEAAFNQLVFTLADDGSPRFRDNKWQQPFAEAARSVDGRPALFTPLVDDRTQWAVQLTPDALWKRYATLSQVAKLPEEEDGEGVDGLAGDRADGAAPASRKAVRRRMDAVLAAGEDVERNAQGEVTTHGVTYFAWARKI
ncbi:methyltransferase type 11 [Niveomyces insectorum RCEF 264]|uniref:Methyltransferase type 11 n=1 Tax=Niveomyces insectorum RCEF 264 TaxID=1081102 RepID=A0A162I8P6_9HYPO|nr:methyltransferase type 11 [Niveomyces insectorum RCEF 264]